MGRDNKRKRQLKEIIKSRREEVQNAKKQKIGAQNDLENDDGNFAMGNDAESDKMETGDPNSEGESEIDVEDDDPDFDQYV